MFLWNQLNVVIVQLIQGAQGASWITVVNTNKNMATHTSRGNTWSWPSSETLQGCPLKCHGRNMEPGGSSLGGTASYFSCLQEHITHVRLCVHVCSTSCSRQQRELHWRSVGKRSQEVCLGSEITFAGVGVCHGPPEALRDCISLSRRSSSAAFLSSSSCRLSSSAVPCGCSYTHLQTHVNTCGQSTGMRHTFTNLWDSIFGINRKLAVMLTYFIPLVFSQNICHRCCPVPTFLTGFSCMCSGVVGTCVFSCE